MNRKKKIKKRKRLNKKEFQDINLNIVPFIDVFSMLNTFLLFSAVFIATGVIEVQIPFISNAPPPKDEKERFFQVKVDVEKDKIEVITSFSEAPYGEQKWQFANTKQGAQEMHARLVQIRRDNQETDKLTLFTEDDVIWENISMILDHAKLRQESDPVFPLKDKDGKLIGTDKENIYPKVVMGSVML